VILPSTVEWVVTTRQGESEFRWGRLDGDIVAEWAGLLSLRFDRRGNVLEFVPAISAPKTAVDKIATGVARAFARSIAGAPALHASGVAFAGRAVACIGASGAGKSTLAAGLCAGDGFSLMADDVLCLERVGETWFATPAEPVLWLAARDGNESKIPAAPRMLQRVPAKLAALVHARFDETSRAVTLRPLKPTEALAVLVESILRFEPVADRWSAEFDVVSSLVDRVPTYELSRPRDLSRARESVEAMSHLAEAHRDA
jgi:hypothetical protein